MSRERNDIAYSLAALCQKMQISCVVQVGAEDGFEADCIREATGCRAVAIDADPKSVKMSPWLEAHETLIGASHTVMDFYVHKVDGLSSQFTREDGAEEKVAMPQQRLDYFCQQHGIEPDALIIDTEGTTLDVLEGCGALLDNVRLIYAEVQTSVIRPGMRLLPEVEAFLSARGFVRREGRPSYHEGPQGNYTWVRP